ncbi:RNB domain-containing ribonuclease [Agromyces cerinus]|uniref:RNB domain-containing protein n=1 Tax=Agromyces cerinus subsp. cerinus TaxID=232089 RepID=A0A1N6HDP8_9MICO|nr:RNB domain-containing ribonuclease [Agromyces cerinus]SIO17846.1 RNB domain-containing protein [Agromyces cerinus subsp. cerinus]
MPSRRTHVTESVAQSELAVALARLRAELDVPESFAPEVLAEAEQAAVADPGTDLRELAFLTIDPPGSTDLDQALHLERRSTGFVVHYAIADVPGWVVPGGAVDREARRRGQTLYAADGRVPLHPVVLSEDRASLLPGADRSAFVWTFGLDERGAVTSTALTRALVRSREQLTYDEAQARIEAGDGDSSLALLREVGLLRIELERARGGASLNSPDEEIVRTEGGGYSLERRHPLPVEEWNAQLSLMTGMAAAQLMLDARVGVLRTMPKPSEEHVTAFRAQTRALGRPWPETISYGEYLRGLDRDDPASLAVMQAASGLFRGAGYLAVDGEVPPDPIQSALAAPYAHVTAPLRRLVDRWGLVVCLALCAGRDVPEWARSSLGELPSLMGASSQRASRLDAESIARVEAALLSTRVGERFTVTVLEVRGERAVLQLADPAVTATCPAPAGIRAGTELEVELLAADIATGTIEFRAAGAA